MTRRARIAIGLGILAVLQLGAVATYLLVQRSRTSQGSAFVAERPSIAETATSISTHRVDGSAHELRWPAPRTRLVHFWATWCPPCVRELPGLLAFGRELRIEVVAIAVDDDWKDIAAFFGGDVPREVVVEPAGAAHKRFGVSTLPDTYLVEPGGRIIERYHGARDWRSPAARAHVLARSRPDRPPP